MSEIMSCLKIPWISENDEGMSENNAEMSQNNADMSENN